MYANQFADTARTGAAEGKPTGPHATITPPALCFIRHKIVIVIVVDVGVVVVGQRETAIYTRG